MFGKQNASLWSDDDPRKKFIVDATFDAFVREQRILPIPEHPEMPWMGPLSSWFNQLEWITNQDGIVACDCLRLENLTEDISDYLGRKIEIPRRNVTNNKYSYREMYNDELIQIVADTFKDDIDYFGFDFDSTATKNIAVA